MKSEPTGDPLDLAIDRILSSWLPPDFTELPKAEQIALGTALMYRVRKGIQEHHENPDDVPLRLSRSAVVPELTTLIGKVVTAAAWAEDEAGTLIQTLSGNWTDLKWGYGNTSNRLIQALRSHEAEIPRQLTDRFDEALKYRHFVVHGIFVDGSFHQHPKTGEPVEFISMKREYQNQRPERVIKGFSAKSLEWLADEFWDIEDALQAIRSRFLEDQEA